MIKWGKDGLLMKLDKHFFIEHTIQGYRLIKNKDGEKQYGSWMYTMKDALILYKIEKERL